MGFEIVESSVLKLFKVPIPHLAGLGDHYYLAETSNLTHCLSWSPTGVELKGIVKVTPQELERVERFISVIKYNIAINNCEHFANYVLYGINLSSQQHTWWKSLGANIISLLQPVETIANNYNSLMLQQIQEELNKNLKQAKIEKANQEHIEFWKSRGIQVQ